jgi:3alpha(or 20beta)-hydroxysteroid dehydrogenase
VAGRLDGKVALITGAARGQGAAEARLFAEHGARVAVTDVADTDDVAAELGDHALALSLDVTEEAQWASAVAATVETFGRLDILVNNAGIGFPPRPLGDEEMEQHHKVWAVNADGVYLGIRAVSAGHVGPGRRVHREHLVHRRPGRRGRHDELHGLEVRRDRHDQTAALELGRHGVRVNSIHPGVIATPMLDAAPPETLERLQRVLDRQPIPRMGTAEEVAYLALYLASDESSYCTGAQFVIDGGHLAGPYREGYGP